MGACKSGAGHQPGAAEMIGKIQYISRCFHYRRISRNCRYSSAIYFFINNTLRGLESNLDMAEVGSSNLPGPTRIYQESQPLTGHRRGLAFLFGKILAIDWQNKRLIQYPPSTCFSVTHSSRLSGVFLLRSGAMVNIYSRKEQVMRTIVMAPVLHESL